MQRELQLILSELLKLWLSCSYQYLLVNFNPLNYMSKFII